MLSHKFTTLFCCFFIIITYQLCVAQICPPSSCGNIPNISSPFRLPNDPPNCGDPRYELTCENNTTLAVYIDHYFGSTYKYIVRAINYANYTIRLIHPSLLGNNNSCSLPTYYIPPSGIGTIGSYSTQITRARDMQLIDITNVNTLMSCPYPVNSSFLVEVVDDSCGHTNNITDHRYLKFGHLDGSDIMDECRIDIQLLMSTSMPSSLKKRSNVSLEEIHASLLNGFELSWINRLCGNMCSECFLNGKRVTCPRRSCFIFPLVSFYCDGMPYWLRNTISYGLWILQMVIVFGIVAHLTVKIIIGIPASMWLLFYVLRRRQRSMFDTIEGFLQSNNNLSPIRYSYKDIKRMTKGFREKLGQGGYGSVYKGKLRSGRIVAVKLLTKPKENGQDFINEIATIGRIHHVNVVKLVGFYAGRFSNKRALVFDFMPNGSLEKYILNRQSPNLLSWERKYEIAVGVARGIEYLHTGCDIQILHFDIKPHNILLDDNFMPKVSDFGLAKLYAIEKNTMTLTAARGTIGYVAPELINRSIGRVSYKADVYSFGMLLMELVGQNRDIKANEGESSQYFPDWIYNRINKGKDIETGDADHIEGEEDDNNDDGNEKRIKRKMTIVGLWCIQMSPVDRPSMSEVVKMLESPNGDIQIPPRPSVPTQIGRYSDQSNWETESSGSIALLGHDANSGDHLSKLCIEMT